MFKIFPLICLYHVVFLVKIVYLCVKSIPLFRNNYSKPITGEQKETETADVTQDGADAPAADDEQQQDGADKMATDGDVIPVGAEEQVGDDVAKQDGGEEGGVMAAVDGDELGSEQGGRTARTEKSERGVFTNTAHVFLLLFLFLFCFSSFPLPLLKSLPAVLLEKISVLFFLTVFQ